MDYLALVILGSLSTMVSHLFKFSEYEPQAVLRLKNRQAAP